MLQSTSAHVTVNAKISPIKYKLTKGPPKACASTGSLAQTFKILKLTKHLAKYYNHIQARNPYRLLTFLPSHTNQEERVSAQSNKNGRLVYISTKTFIT